MTKEISVYAMPGARKVGDVIEIEEARHRGVVAVGEVIDVVEADRATGGHANDLLLVRVLAGEV